jgi:uncharacterized protein (DUF58 family)
MLRPRRSLRPSRAGWLFVAITFGVGFAALNTGNNLLYLVLSLMLAFLVLSGFLSESALRGLRVERVVPRELHAGRPNPVTLRIHNHDRRVGSFAVVVEDRIRGAHGPEPAGRCFALHIAPGETVVRRYGFRPDRRGVFEFTGHRISTRFPFGLFVKSMVLDAPAHALVYPRIEDIGARAPEPGAFEEGDEAEGRRGDGTLALGLREYASGDGQRRINWRHSVRRGSLFVSETESESQAEIEVELRGGGTAPTDAFEVHVARAASEVVHHLESGLRVGLRTHSERFDADAGRRHRAELLRHLALIEPEATPEQSA